MPRYRTYRTRAIVLKRRDQGEADRVLTVFTPNMGKRTVMARGVRKTASRKAGHLEPFTYTALLMAQGKTWDVVTQAETVIDLSPNDRPDRLPLLGNISRRRGRLWWYRRGRTTCCIQGQDNYP